MVLFSKEVPCAIVIGEVLMPRKPDKPLVNVLMTPEELAELDEWRHNNRFAARSEAMRWLLKAGMRRMPKVSPEERQAVSA
jgi:hypothetical protein